MEIRTISFPGRNLMLKKIQEGTSIYSAEMISYLRSMSATEQFYIYLKEMQETAKKIKPAPKTALEKIVLPNGSAKHKVGDASKREDNCLL